MPETGFTDGDVVTAAQLNQIEDQQITVCTSTTRPSAVTGRWIAETDTEQYRAYDGTTWRLIAGFNWVDFTPTFNNIATSATDGVYRFADGGMWVYGDASVSGAATGAVSVTMPASEACRNDGIYALGVARYVDATSTNATGQCYVPPNSSTITFTNVNGASLSATVPFTWASGDTIRFQIFIPL